MRRTYRASKGKVGKIYYLRYIRGEGYFIDEGEFSREPNPYMHRIDRDVIHHVVEDICVSCPISAVQGIDPMTSLKTCDPRDYAGKCGLAELRVKCLYGGKEG
jgi:hypothetical protein